MKTAEEVREKTACLLSSQGIFIEQWALCVCVCVCMCVHANTLTKLLINEVSPLYCIVEWSLFLLSIHVHVLISIVLHSGKYTKCICDHASVNQPLGAEVFPE